MMHRHNKEAGLGGAFASSLLLHAAILAGFILFNSFFQPTPTVVPVYYVDILNLPTENPRKGSSTARGTGNAPAAPPREREAMSLPPDRPAPANRKDAENKPPTETDREFRERLARLENRVGAQRTDNAVEELRRKLAAGNSGAGMPDGNGTEAGSEYGSYIQSRLRDAFALTIAFRSKNPMVVARLTIDRNGKLIGFRIERSTGDRVFEDSVARAVDRAAAKFPPPPGRAEFRHGFIFKPEGVGIN